MSDIIVGPPGQQINIGDPSHCDEKYRDGIASISSDAATELNRYPQLVLQDYRARGGPKTLAYLNSLQQLANSQLVYGCFPQLPDRIED